MSIDDEILPQLPENDGAAPTAPPPAEQSAPPDPLHYQRFVRSIARHYRNLGLEMVDLMQDGNVGLIEACRRYRPRPNCTFETYARHRIRGAIVEGLSRGARTIPIPRDVLAMHARARFGDPTDAQSDRIISADIVMNRMKGCDKSSDYFINQINSREPTPLSALVAHEEQSAIRRVVDGMDGVLDARQSRVVRGRFGIGGAAATIAELGEELSASHHSVREIEIRALVKLARAFGGIDDEVSTPRTSERVTARVSSSDEKTLAGDCKVVKHNNVIVRPSVSHRVTGNRGRRKSADSPSRYRGVAVAKNKERPWLARIMVAKVNTTLGYYATDVEAARAYDEACRRLGRRVVNFPPGGGMEELCVGEGKPCANPLGRAS